MNQNIINKYQIRFENKVFNWETGKEVYKSLDANNKYLYDLLIDWTASEINDMLLPDINNALSNPNIELENGSETIAIFIKKDNTSFYNMDEGLVYEMSTQDLKEIIIGWRDFLLTPPLNGTKMP